MGFPVTGGKNGTLTSFKSQVNALAACHMRIGVWDGMRAKTVSTQPFSSIDVWFPTSAEQKMLWPSTITFSHEFYSTLVSHALPVNIEAVQVFAGSPRKLDLLFWLGYRLNTLTAPLKHLLGSARGAMGAGVQPPPQLPPGFRRRDCPDPRDLSEASRAADRAGMRHSTGRPRGAGDPAASRRPEILSTHNR